MGYIGFSLTFVRSSAGTAITASPEFLGQLVFDATGALAAAMSALTTQVTLS